MINQKINDNIIYALHFIGNVSFLMILPVIGLIVRDLQLPDSCTGIIIGIGGLGWGIFAKRWGILSDKKSIKLILFFLFMGYFIVFLIWTIFVDYFLVAKISGIIIFIIMIIFRLLAASFIGGLVPVFTKYITNIYGVSLKKLANLGIIFGLAMFIGPFIAGFLAKISLMTPFYIAAILPIFALFLIIFFKDSKPFTIRQEKLLRKSKKQLSLFDKRTIDLIFIMFFFMNIVFSFNILIALFIYDKFSLVSKEYAANLAGITLAIIGITILITQFIISRVNIDKSQRFILDIGIIILAIANFCVIFSTNIIMFIVCSVFLSIGGGIIGPLLNVINAKSVNSDEQGAAAGNLSLAQGLGMTVSPIIGGFLYQVNISLPYIFSSFCFFIYFSYLIIRFLINKFHSSKI